MTIGNCRNCGSAEKYSREIRVGGTYYANLLPVGPRLFGSANSFAAYEIHVCGSCGLAEWFVPQRLLDEVKEKFTRMPEG